MHGHTRAEGARRHGTPIGELCSVRSLRRQRSFISPSSRLASRGAPRVRRARARARDRDTVGGVAEGSSRSGRARVAPSAPAERDRGQRAAGGGRKRREKRKKNRAERKEAKKEQKGAEKAKKETKRSEKKSRAGEKERGGRVAGARGERALLFDSAGAFELAVCASGFVRARPAQLARLREAEARLSHRGDSFFIRTLGTLLKTLRHFARPAPRPPPAAPRPRRATATRGPSEAGSPPAALSNLRVDLRSNQRAQGARLGGAPRAPAKEPRARLAHLNLFQSC